jgi:hypothetical protein
MIFQPFKDDARPLDLLMVFSQSTGHRFDAPASMLLAIPPNNRHAV